MEAGETKARLMSATSVFVSLIVNRVLAIGLGNTGLAKSHESCLYVRQLWPTIGKRLLIIDSSAALAKKIFSL